MNEFLGPLLVGAKTLVLVLGSIVAVLAYRAYRRTKIEGLRYFAIGLLIITVGTVLVGAIHHFAGVSVMMGVLLETLFISVGFIVMIYALYGKLE